MIDHFKKEDKKGFLDTFLNIIIIGPYLLFIVPVFFAKGNPFTHSETGVYFDNCYNVLLYAFLTFILMSAPFVKKMSVFKSLVSLTLGCWSLVGLYFELINLQYPEIILNNPYNFDEQLKVALLFLSLLIMLLYRYKWWKPNFKS